MRHNDHENVHHTTKVKLQRPCEATLMVNLAGYVLVPSTGGV